MAKPRRVSEETLRHVRALLRAGMPIDKIAEAAGTSKQTVWCQVEVDRVAQGGHRLTIPELLFLARRVHDRVPLTRIAVELRRDRKPLAQARDHHVVRAELTRLQRIGVRSRDPLLAAWNANTLTLSDVVTYTDAELRRSGRTSTTS